MFVSFKPAHVEARTMDAIALLWPLRHNGDWRVRRLLVWRLRDLRSHRRVWGKAADVPRWAAWMNGTGPYPGNLALK